jgi:hypothetical protein
MKVLLVDDAAVASRSLNVVRRESLLTYQHEAGFRLWILL